MQKQCWHCCWYECFCLVLSPGKLTVIFMLSFLSFSFVILSRNFNDSLWLCGKDEPKRRKRDRCKKCLKNSSLQISCSCRFSRPKKIIKPYRSVFFIHLSHGIKFMRRQKLERKKHFTAYGYRWTSKVSNKFNGEIKYLWGLLWFWLL